MGFACYIIDSTQKIAFNAINLALIQRNWYLGKRIAEEELKGKDRAEYGIEIIKSLSKSLTDIYGKGFNVRQLYYCESFYKTFPEILHTVCAKSYCIRKPRDSRVVLYSFSDEQEIKTPNVYNGNLTCQSYSITR